MKTTADLVAKLRRPNDVGPARFAVLEAEEAAALADAFEQRARLLLLAAEHLEGALSASAMTYSPTRLAFVIREELGPQSMTRADEASEAGKRG